MKENSSISVGRSGLASCQTRRTPAEAAAAEKARSKSAAVGVVEPTPSGGSWWSCGMIHLRGIWTSAKVCDRAGCERIAPASSVSR